MFYLYEIRESDGNDCRVYDCIVEGETREEADSELSEHFEFEAKHGKWESDGNFCGYYFPCDCEIPEMPEEKIPCDQCVMVTVNGIPCHEIGCPTERKLRRVQKLIDNWECSHGGITVSDPKEYSTEEEAEENCASYHSRYRI